MTERGLRRRLQQAAVPGASEARERGWSVIQAAWAERSAASPNRRLGRPVLALVAALLALAVGLSPAGAKVGELISGAIEGARDARPSLTALPASGEVLVTSREGAWIVREDGSQRLLGDYDEASWSPHALFVAAAGENRLTAVDPHGDVRWSIAQARHISDPRWAPSGFRIAYRSGGSLRVVAGDGTEDRLVRAGVAPVAPSWKPVEPGALTRSPSGVGTHVVSFAAADGTVRTVDVDARRVLWRANVGSETAVRQLAWLRGPKQVWEEDRSLLAILTGDGLETRVANGRSAFAWGFPQASRAVEMAATPGGRVAVITRMRGEEGAGSKLVVLDARHPGRGERLLFSGPGRLSGLAWSPGGRWLVVGWRDADQWLFLRTGDHRGPPETIAIDAISRQFDPGSTGESGFPTPGEWCCPSARAGRP